MKVDWIHNFSDEPCVIYGELRNDLEEVRKIEFYKNGDIGYVQKNGDSYLAFLSEMNWLMKEEIEEDSQFKVTMITQNEFEEVWKKAINNKK